MKFNKEKIFISTTVVLALICLYQAGLISSLKTDPYDHINESTNNTITSLKSDFPIYPNYYSTGFLVSSGGNGINSVNSDNISSQKSYYFTTGTRDSDSSIAQYFNKYLNENGWTMTNSTTGYNKIYSAKYSGSDKNATVDIIISPDKDNTRIISYDLSEKSIDK